jgi:hypothetical protein
VVACAGCGGPVEGGAGGVQVRAGLPGVVLKRLGTSA